MQRTLLKVTVFILFFAWQHVDASPVVQVSGPSSTTIPLEHTKFGQLFVRLKMGDRELRMLLDTGGKDLSVDSKIAAAQSVKPESGTQRKVAMGAAVVDQSLAFVDWTIGKLTLHRCPTAITEFVDLRKNIQMAGFEEFDGFVGVDFLIFLRARIDFEKKTLFLRRP